MTWLVCSTSIRKLLQTLKSASLYNIRRLASIGFTITMLYEGHRQYCEISNVQAQDGLILKRPKITPYAKTGCLKEML